MLIKSLHYLALDLRIAVQVFSVIFPMAMAYAYGYGYHAHWECFYSTAGLIFTPKFSDLNFESQLLHLNKDLVR